MMNDDKWLDKWFMRSVMVLIASVFILAASMVLKLAFKVWME